MAKGLGTAIKRFTGALGLPHCAGCARRAATLDRISNNVAEAARRWAKRRKRHKR